MLSGESLTYLRRWGHGDEDLELHGSLLLEVGLDGDDGVVGARGLGGLERQVEGVVRERPGPGFDRFELGPAGGELGQGEGCGGTDVNDVGLDDGFTGPDAGQVEDRGADRDATLVTNDTPPQTIPISVVAHVQGGVSLVTRVISSRK